MEQRNVDVFIFVWQLQRLLVGGIFSFLVNKVWPVQIDQVSDRSLDVLYWSRAGKWRVLSIQINSYIKPLWNMSILWKTGQFHLSVWKTKLGGLCRDSWLQHEDKLIINTVCHRLLQSASVTAIKLTAESFIVGAVKARCVLDWRATEKYSNLFCHVIKQRENNIYVTLMWKAQIRQSKIKIKN